MKLILSFFPLLLLGCPPGPVAPQPDADAIAPAPTPVPSVFDGSTTNTCYLACKALKGAGCAEGDSVLCITRLQTINDMRTERNLAHGNLALTCDDLVGVHVPDDVTKTGQKCTPVGDR